MLHDCQHLFAQHGLQCLHVVCSIILLLGNTLPCSLHCLLSVSLDCGQVVLVLKKEVLDFLLVHLWGAV